MGDSQTPEIDVEELKARIRAEVAKRPKVVLPEITELGTDGFEDRGASAFDRQQITSHLAIAEENADVGRRMLPMAQFHPVTRWAARIVGRIVLYLGEVFTFQQRSFNDSILQSMRLVSNGLPELEDRTRESQGQIKALEVSTDKRFREMARRYDQALLDRDRHIADLEQTLARLNSRMNFNEQNLARYLADGDRPVQPARSAETAQGQTTTPFDPLYGSFEDEFRGKPEEIKDRMRVYLPNLREIASRIGEKSILDIGCGRGEWLEILREEGIKARGVDTNAAQIAACLEKGLDAVADDGIDHLRNLEDGSVAGVTAFHFIEHLPLTKLIEFLNEVFRVLVPCGVALLETPNPQNLIVGACNFYVDPTHVKPLHPASMQFIMQSRGFQRVELVYLHPFPEKFQFAHDSELAPKLNEFFYGPQDFAVMGFKP